MAAKPIDLSKHRARDRHKLATELADTLKRLGGAAHMGTLIEVVMADRRRRGVTIEMSLPRTIQTALKRHEAANADDEAAVFYRPFGPDSHRWALRARPTNVVDLPARIAVEVEAILEDHGVSANSADGIEQARRQVINVLSTGETCSTVDVTILDELERRSRMARLKTRH